MKKTSTGGITPVRRNLRGRASHSGVKSDYDPMKSESRDGRQEQYPNTTRNNSKEEAEYSFSFTALVRNIV
jgi:hypothetical protein